MRKILNKISIVLVCYNSSFKLKKFVQKIPNETKIFIIDKPEAAQSIIRIGHFGQSRKSPDYFPITLMNTILGGSFTSRLNYNLREPNGFTYGARSYFIMGKDIGPFIALSSVQTNSTSQSIKEFFNEFFKIKENVTNEEVLGAKNYVALGYPNNFDMNVFPDPIPPTRAILIII